MQEWIDFDYRKENFSFDFDTQVLETLIHQKFGENSYTVMVSASANLKNITNIQLTAGTGYNYREYDFSKSDLPFKPKENKELFSSLTNVFSSVVPLMAYLEKKIDLTK